MSASASWGDDDPAWAWAAAAALEDKENRATNVKIEVAASPAPSAASDATTVTTASDTNEDARRKRHNANERRRTNALKTRILGMREELSALERQRDRLRAAAEQQTAVTQNAAYLDTVKTIDQLRSEQQQLRKKLHEFDMQNSTYQTILTEFAATPESRRLAGNQRGKQRMALLGEVSDDDSGDADSDGRAGTGLGDEEIYSDLAPIFQRVLLPRPMPLDQVMACVKQFYEEIMRFRSESEFDSLGGEILGWRDRRILSKQSLRFMLSQHFEYVPAQELVYKTWNLLTTLSLYRRIQPRTVEVKTLQRVTEDCVIVRVSVSSTDNKEHHSILLIARGRIDGGFLITYRSIPLSPAQQEFARSEGNYVQLNNWYMFLDAVTNRGEPACEVTLGGAVQNQSVEYLRYLMMEVVAAVVRWQSAVGHSRFRLTSS